MAKNSQGKEKEQPIEAEGTVVECLRGRFRVAVDGSDGSASGMTVLATIGGKMGKYKIRVVAGDRVKVEMSPYDLTRGRITYRYK